MNIVSLREYAKHKDGTYVAVEMDDQSKALLDHFVVMNLGLDERVDPQTYHVTIIYSKTPVPSAENISSLTTETKARAVGYEVFKTKVSGKCLVLRLDFTFAEFLNKKLTMDGATSDYATYKPHVTICYNYTGPDDVSTLPVPQFELGFGEVTVKPLDVDYIPSNA